MSNSIQLQYKTPTGWVDVSQPWGSERLAWISLGGDDLDYRTVDLNTGEVLTSKENKS